MDDPEIVMAAASVASAVMALGALVVSTVGLSRSSSAVKDAQNAREGAASAQWKMSEHLEAIADAQARAARAAVDGIPGTIQTGGKLSARLVSTGRSERLVVANVGTRRLTVEAIEVDQGVLIAGQAEGVLGAELEPGEDLSLVAGLTFGMNFPLTVTLRWRDQNGATDERVQKVTPT